MTTMRAKLIINSVTEHKQENKIKNNQETYAETLKMNAVGKSGTYPEDGSDEDNSYAKWSPSAEFEIYIANPNLFGKFKIGQKFYVDFTEVQQ